MEILKFDDGPAPKRAASKKRGVNSSRKTILGIAAAAAIAVVGSTLAANITINTGSGLEFGQGITATAACTVNSDSITMTPTSTYVNGSGTNGNFYLSGISFSGQGLKDCHGKTFTIQAYDGSNPGALVLSTYSGTSYTSATFAYSSVASTPVTSYSSAITSVGGTQGSTATIAFGTGTGDATAGQIYKLTLQSQ